MFRLLGGGVAGDLHGLPRAQLAVLPGTTHVTLVDRADWLLSMITAFLDAPMPKAEIKSSFILKKTTAPSSNSVPMIPFVGKSNPSR